jgi:hypothetical protein
MFKTGFKIQAFEFRNKNQKKTGHQARFSFYAFIKIKAYVLSP